MSPVANARMYSVNAAVKAHWHRLLGHALAQAGLPWPLLDYDAPAPLSALWARGDLGLVMMCGMPFAQRTPRPTLVAAPIPSPPRYAGAPVYFTDLVVRADAPARTLADTFGGVAGYTLASSFSGGVAFADWLTSHAAGLKVYRATVGNLIHARGVIDALVAGRIDVGPLDSYVHDLLRQHEPAYAAQVRVLVSTPARPIPPLVATAPVDAATLGALRAALAAAVREPALADTVAALQLAGFATPAAQDYEPLAELGRRHAHAFEPETA